MTTLSANAQRIRDRYAKGNGVPQDYLMAAKPARMLDCQGPFIVGIRSIGVCLRGQSC